MSEKTVSNNVPGEAAGGGLKDAPAQTGEEVDFTISAMEALERDDSSETEGEVGSSVPGASTSGASPADPASPPRDPIVEIQPLAAPPSTVDPAGLKEPLLATPQSTDPKAPQPQEVKVDPAAPQTEVANKTQETSELPEEGFRRLVDQFNANREKIVEVVAEQVYKLSEEEALAIQTEPDKALPRLAARIHINAVQGVLQHVAQQIPTVVQGILEARERYTQLESKFYEMYPQLDKTKHGKEVVQLAAAFRAQNPNAPFSEVARVVGAQAIVMLGLHQGAAAQVGATQKVVPFTPAVVNGGVGQQQKASSNPYEVWDQMIEMDERGAFDE